MWRADWVTIGTQRLLILLIIIIINYIIYTYIDNPLIIIIRNT